MLKNLINVVFDRLGYKITNKNALGFKSFDPNYLANVCDPNTVIDVGVGYGSDPIYQAFSNAYLVLIEPLKEYQSVIDNILSKYEGIAYYKAVDAKPGVKDIYVNIKYLALSSLLQRAKLTFRESHKLEKRTVETVTLDDLLNPINELKQPIVLKIDTEGNELNVLRGAKNLLKSTDFVIIEVSIAERFVDGYKFEDLVILMVENGFEVFSFLSVAHSPRELRPRFADIIFRRVTG